MRKKNFKYYSNTLLLKANALKHRLLYTLKAGERKNQALKYQDAFEKHTFNFDIRTNDIKYFQTYGYFKKVADLEKAVLINEKGICYSSVGSPYKKHFNPLFPSYYGLVVYNEYLSTKSTETLDIFWKQVNALKEYGHFKDQLFYLPIPFDYPDFGLKAPWMAGITQALAASMFFRARLLMPDGDFQKYHKGCIDSLYLNTVDNGIFCKSPEGKDWIEEYPSHQPSYVLNGFIFCIIAVIEYFIISQEQTYKTKAIRLIETLMASLHEYKIGKFWRYDRKHWKFSNLEYQALHVFQFLHLYKLTNLDLFKEISKDSNKHMNWNNFFYFYQMPKRNIKISD